MKFGKQLEELSVPKYRGYYIQYKELKKALKVWTGLEKDHSTVQEVTHWASSFLRLGPNPEVSPEMRLNELLRHEMKRISQFAELEEGGISRELKALEEESRRPAADAAALLRRLDDLGEQLVNLKGFAQLNFSGFRKILKKYDKWNETKARVTPWFMAEVMHAPFMKINYEAMLERMNRIAAALRGRAAGSPAASLASSGSRLDQVLWTGRDAVFVIDPKDTMKVHVLLAKHLTRRGQYMTMQAASATGRTRTTCVFFDSPSLAVYSASLDGVGAPVPATQLRHADGDAVVLVQDAGQGAPATEVLLTRAEAAKLARGEAAAAAAPGALAAEAVKAVEGLSPFAQKAAAQSALAAALRSTQKDQHKTVAQASYIRSVFQDKAGSFIVVLDEEVRMAKTSEAFTKAPIGMEYLNHNVVTIITSPNTRSVEGAEWFRMVQESTNLLQVVGFSMFALSVATFYAKERGLPEPRWYHSIMQRPEEEGENAPPTSQAELGTLAPAPQVLPPQPRPKEAAAAYDAAAAARLASPGCRRLLHEFNTTPEEQNESLAHGLEQIDEGSVPADVGGGLGAPLLARPRPAPEPRGGAFRVLLRAFGLAAATESDDLPVRDAIVAVQPKTLYSNERTFLEWMHFATLLATTGVVMMHGMSHVGTVALGRFIVLVAVFLAGWSFYTFSWRADALDRKQIIDYKDPVGPGAVVFALLIGLLGTTLHALSIGGDAAS